MDVQSSRQTLSSLHVASEAVNPFSDSVPSAEDVLSQPLQLPGSCNWGLSQHLVSPADADSGASHASGRGLVMEPQTAAAAEALGSSANVTSSASSLATQGIIPIEMPNQIRGGEHVSARQQPAEAWRGVLADVSNVNDVSRQRCEPQRKTLKPAQAASTSTSMLSGPQVHCNSPAARAGLVKADPTPLNGTDERLRSWYSRWVAKLSTINPLHFVMHGQRPLQRCSVC